MSLKKLLKNILKTYDFFIYHQPSLLILSNQTNNIAENPDKKFIKNPLKNPRIPSFLQILVAQSKVFAYKTSVRPSL